MTQSAILSPVMDIRIATDREEWDSFLDRQHFRPFLQSWTMGEVYQDIGQTPVRLIASNDEKTQAICFGHVVRARRGKHISVPYGPVVDEQLGTFEAGKVTSLLVKALKNEAKKHGCSFIRQYPKRGRVWGDCFVDRVRSRWMHERARLRLSAQKD